MQVYVQEEGIELYIANAGRFNAESYVGWNEVSDRVSAEGAAAGRNLTHSQVQTLIGSIGFSKGNDIWIPSNDRGRLDRTLANDMVCHEGLPTLPEAISNVLCEVDVIWIRRGSGEIAALFEVEHSTPVYSGLLRFNDFRLAVPTMRPRFTIVSNDTRRSLFVRQVNRPTFKASGLVDVCTFLEYANVYEWWKRLSGKRDSLESAIIQ